MPLNGGAIAAVLAKKKEGEEGSGSEDSDSDGSIEELILEPVAAKKVEPKAPEGYIGIMGQRVPTPRTPPIASAAVPAPLKPKHAAHPKHHFVLEQIKLVSGVTTERKSEYSDLLCFLFYITIFLVIVIMQSDASSTYTITSTHSDFLFSEATETIAFSDGRVVDRIPSLQKLTTWMEDVVVDGVFVDPQCGDGLCERPLEFPSVFSGLFGCTADCGEFVNTTDVTVEFYLDEEAYTDIDDEGWENVAWNLCWDSEGICYFSEDRLLFSSQEEYDAAAQKMQAARTAAEASAISQVTKNATASTSNTTAGAAASNTTATSTTSSTAELIDTITYDLSIVDGDWRLDMIDFLVPGRITTTPLVNTSTSASTSTNASAIDALTAVTNATIAPEIILNWTRCSGGWDAEKSPFYNIQRDTEQTNEYFCPSDRTNAPTPSFDSDYYGNDDCSGLTVCTGDCFTQEDCFNIFGASCQDTIAYMSGNGECDTYLDCKAFNFDGGDCSPPPGLGDDEGGDDDDERRLGEDDDDDDGGDEDGDGGPGEAGVGPGGSGNGPPDYPWYDQDEIDARCQCDYMEVIDHTCCKEECNNPECYYSFGECADTVALFWECSYGCPAFLLGDGVCNPLCNNAACQLDGGDCCYPAENQQVCYYGRSKARSEALLL
jgi:hypothetical protein